MNFMGVNWDIIFSAKNYFIPFYVFAIIFIMAFIKQRDLTLFLGICIALISIFIYSPWGENLDYKVNIVLIIIIIMLILGLIIVISNKDNNNRY